MGNQFAPIIFTAGLLVASAAMKAQQPVIPIWPGVAPGSESWTQKEVEFLDGGKRKMVRNVVQPTLTAYLPERPKANGVAVIICPGGAFRFLSWQNEGTAAGEGPSSRGGAGLGF